MPTKRSSGRRPTQYDVARLAGVSQAAVSQVLNESTAISMPEETRQRILKTIEKLGYRPNTLARSLRMGQTHTLGLIFPDSANPFFAEVGRHIEARAFELGYSLFLCNTGGRPDRELFYSDVLSRKQVDGIIFVAAGDQADCLHSLMEQRIPVLVVDRELSDCAVDVVLLDNFQGGCLGTRHLLSLGHRQIACIAGPSNVNPSAERLAGYKAALLEGGIEADASLVRRGEFQMESGWKMAHELLGGHQPPTAIFACNDLMAIGVLRAAAECGLHVPEDLSVVGFDNIELASYSVPPLTTVAQPTHEIGTRAVEILIERIKNPEQEIRRERLGAELVVRGSTTVKPTEAALPTPTEKTAVVLKSTHTEVL